MTLRASSNLCPPPPPFPFFLFIAHLLELAAAVKVDRKTYAASFTALLVFFAAVSGSGGGAGGFRLMKEGRR